MPSPEIVKPRMPVELSVNDILDPANDKPKSVAPFTISSSSTEVSFVVWNVMVKPKSKSQNHDSFHLRSYFS